MRNQLKAVTESERKTDQVLGGGLLLTNDERGITLHTLNISGSGLLGTYASAAEAWRAVDEFDLDVEVPLAA
jgi:hypothetical protein